MNPELLCESPEAKILRPFIDEIFNLSFNETPDYDKLKFSLVKGILDLNETPSKEFDWNQNFAHDTNEIDFNLNISKESNEENELMVGEEDACREEAEEEAKQQPKSELFNLERHQSGQSNNSSNLQRKMSQNGGYQFQHNTNQEAM